MKEMIAARRTCGELTASIPWILRFMRRPWAVSPVWERNLEVASVLELVLINGEKLPVDSGIR